MGESPRNDASIQPARQERAPQSGGDNNIQVNMMRMSGGSAQQREHEARRSSRGSQRSHQLADHQTTQQENGLMQTVIPEAPMENGRADEKNSAVEDQANQETEERRGDGQEEEEDNHESSRGRGEKRSRRKRKKSSRSKSASKKRSSSKKRWFGKK